jgi:FkbM family methyltransferase
MARQGIDLLIDVGANEGHYADSCRTHGYEGSIVSFEPLAGALARLEERARDDPRWECHRLVLGSWDVPSVELNVADNSQSSSVLAMESAHISAFPTSTYVSTEQVPMARLDSLDLPLPESAMLKADVQGYELEVLRGAAGVIGRLKMVELELSVVSLYKDQPLLQEVVQEMQSLGFDLVALEPEAFDPSSGALLQANGAFLNSSRPAFPRWRSRLASYRGRLSGPPSGPEP